MTNVRMGVFYLLAHLTITLVIIIGYIITLVNGQPDETLKVAIFTIIGYWFGAVGMDKIRPQSKNKGESNNE